MTGRWFGMLGVVLASMWSGAPAFASVPQNDTIDHAEPVTSLPFSTGFDTAHSTESPGDVQCGIAPDPVSVWYRFTPQRTVRVGVAVSGGGSYPTIGVATGSPGALTVIQCDLFPVLFTAEAGVTYYIDIGACCAPAGRGTLEIARVPRIRLTATVDPVAHADPSSGGITVTGTISCSAPVTIGYTDGSSTVSEKVNRFEAISGTGFDMWSGPCGPKPSPWTFPSGPGIGSRTARGWLWSSSTR